VSCGEPRWGRVAWATPQVLARGATRWSARCWSAGGPCAHTWVGAVSWANAAVSHVITAPPPGNRQPLSSLLTIGAVITGIGLEGGRGGGETPLLPELRALVGDLAKPVQRAQMHGSCRGSRDASVIGRAHREGGRGPVRELHHEVRVDPLPNADARHALATQGVMRMGDG